MTLRIIGGKFKGRLLQTPKGSSTRPTQGMLREAVFNICQNVIEGAQFLDLFAGSGAMGLEALSRGALHVTFVEQNRNAIASIYKNIEELQVPEQTTVFACNADTAIKRLQGKNLFDIVYIDPPYDLGAKPFADALISQKLLREQAFIFIEERSRSKKLAPNFPELTWINSRQFGEALLHQYRFHMP